VFLNKFYQKEGFEEMITFFALEKLKDL